MLHTPDIKAPMQPEIQAGLCRDVMLLPPSYYVVVNENNNSARPAGPKGIRHNYGNHAGSTL